MAAEMGQNIGKKTYWFAAHGRIILVFQDPCDLVLELCFLLCKCILTWYHRAVAECESTASLPEAFPWLHPEKMIQ